MMGALAVLLDKMDSTLSTEANDQHTQAASE